MMSIISSKQGKTIGGRITKAVLVICIITMLVSAGAFNTARMRIQQLMYDTGNEIGASASEKSSQALLEQSVTSLQDFVTARAELLEAQLMAVVDSLAVLRLYAEMLDIYDYTSFLPLTPFAHTIMERNPWIDSLYVTTAGGDSLFFCNLVLYDDIDLRERPWYIGTVAAGDTTITDTFLSVAGQGLIVTISTPIFLQNGEIAGVIAVDILMSVLAETVDKISGGGVDFSMLIGRDRIIAAPYLVEMGQVLDLPPWLYMVAAEESGAVSAFVPNWINDESYEIEMLVIWEPLNIAYWQFVGMVLVADVVAPAEEMRTGIETLASSAIADAQRDVVATGIATVVALGVTFIIGIFYSRLIAKRIARPVVGLTEDAVKIGNGELDHVLAINTGDEIEILANTINKMLQSIKQITGEKERISAELNVAAQIQASMLPCIFPPFPGHSEFEIYAYMIPAKEVGGDFYDFFLVDENTLAVVIADVSGKGVPAALFMAIAKTLIKDSTQSGKSPKDVLEAVNNTLCENNEAMMFVTVFLGILDIQTSCFTYANAGHNPPLIKRHGSQFEWLNELKPGFVLGGMEDKTYTQGEVQLNAGDIIFMYTDGVTEAENPQFDLFTEVHLQNVANRHSAVDLNEFIAHIKAEIDMFASGAVQSDDITMLLLKMTEGGEAT